jgi:hypothetical protein
MPAIYTTIGGFPLMVAKALEAQGIDADQTLSRCGIDRHALADPDARVPVDQVGELLRLAITETGDPAFGLKVGTY